MKFPQIRRTALPASMAGPFLFLALALSTATSPLQAAEDYSPAERAIFMADQMRNVRPPATLRYTFRKAGSLEAGFDDTVTLALKARPDGRCCTATGDFLTGERKLRLPEVDDVKANPVVLYFLERDIREMNRLTKGSQNYFRKRIRMAIYQGASVQQASFRYQGRTVAGQEITVTPYADDPNHARFEKFVTKQYRFQLSDAVPGGVYGIRTRIAGAAGAVPVLHEEMLIEGAEAGTP